MTLVTPGHTWSHLVTTGDMKFVIHLTLALLAHSQLGQLPLNDAGHSWSHLVTTGHKLFLGHCWSHWLHPSHLIPLWVRDIGPDTQTDGSHIMYRLPVAWERLLIEVIDV